MILLDTDHCVFFIRGHAGVVSTLATRLAEQPAISIITAGELYFGALRSAKASENLARCQAFIRRVILVPLEQPTMLRFAEIKAGLYARGERIEDPDLWIAATALTHQAPLVTHNASHFARIPGLRLEDWSV